MRMRYLFHHRNFNFGKHLFVVVISPRALFFRLVSVFHVWTSKFSLFEVSSVLYHMRAIDSTLMRAKPEMIRKLIHTQILHSSLNKSSFAISINCFSRYFISVQFSSVTQSCPTLCNPMNCSTPGLPVHHQLPEFTQTHVQETYMQVREQQLELDMEQQTASKWEKEYVKAVYCHPAYLIYLYAEYIMRNAGLDEAQAGIKTARRNITNLRYADDTTLMAESEEELKSLLIK